MEGFWESLADIAATLAKALIALVAIRLMIFFFGYKVYVPLLDDFLLRFLEFFRPG
jgi:hypothetical protein